MDSMYLENLDEFVNDEGKIVTYKWLSLTLGVHSNVAKQMLYHFVTSQRNADKGDDLNVTYLLSGLEEGKDGQPDTHKIMVVKEENLEATKAKMKKVISVHVYSVQKSKLLDMSVLYTANYDKVKENIMSINKHSGISCLEAKVRSAADLEKLKSDNSYQAPVEPTRIPSKYKPSHLKSSPKKESPSGGTKSSGKGNAIASMFSRQAQKPDGKANKDEQVKNTENKSAKDTKTPTSAGAKKGGISSFFSKGPVNKKPATPVQSSDSPATTESTPVSVKSEVIDSPVKTESTISSSIKTESQDSSKENESEKMEIESPPKKKKKETTKKKTQSKLQTSQKRGRNKKNNDEEPLPKRKRIMQLSDSESSGEESEVEEECPLPPSPPPEPSRIESESEDEIPGTPQPEAKVNLLGKRNKKKKLVDKTFMDEDGFFVTKKEYEYVSDSEEENPLPVSEIVKPEDETSAKGTSSPMKAPAKVETKKPSPAKKKQANIMNFFKKK